MPNGLLPSPVMMIITCLFQKAARDDHYNVLFFRKTHAGSSTQSAKRKRQKLKPSAQQSTQVRLPLLNNGTTERFCVCGSPSLSLALSLSIYLSLCLSFSLSLYSSLARSLPHAIPLSLYQPLSLFLAASLSCPPSPPPPTPPLFSHLREHLALSISLIHHDRQLVFQLRLHPRRENLD